MHQTVNNVLRTLVHTNPPCYMTQARDIIDDALATAMHAMQTTIATTLGSTPGALAFAWDMFLNVKWLLIGRPLHVLMNIMSMRIYNVPIGSDISLTMLWDNKFWRKCTIQLSWEIEWKILTLLNMSMSMVTWPYYCVKDYWVHQHTQGSAVLLTIPHTPVKTVLSMNCIWGFLFLPLNFLLHLTFKWVIGGVFWI